MTSEQGNREFYRQRNVFREVLQSPRPGGPKVSNEPKISRGALRDFGFGLIKCLDEDSSRAFIQANAAAAAEFLRVSDSVSEISIARGTEEYHQSAAQSGKPFAFYAHVVMNAEML